MGTTRLNYHVGLKRTSVYRIVTVVVFALLLNLINIGAFSKGSSIELNKAALQAETELGRIYNTINLPLKIIGDLFQKEKGIADTKENSVSDNGFFAILPKQQRTSNELTKKIAFTSVSASKSINYINTSAIANANGILNFMHSNDTIRCLLLLLILFSVLPRGIPVIIKIILNKNFAFPDFVFNKVGFFCFLTECKWRKHEDN